MLKRKKPGGQSLIEFLALILFILAVFLAFQKYIVRGLSGQWKGVGDALGQGRIYDPNMTTECAYYAYPTRGGFWYNRTCFEETCQTHLPSHALMAFNLLVVPLPCYKVYDPGCNSPLSVMPPPFCLNSCRTAMCNG